MIIPHRRPRLGVHLSNHVSAAETLELARLAEAESLDSVWVSEDLYFRGAVPIAGAIAAVTSTIEIGFGVLSPQIRHASLLAMESAALVDLAGSRVVMGLGAGVAARTRAMGVEPMSPLATVRDVVDVFRRLSAGESVTRSDGTLRAAGLQLSFTDLPPVPPVYVAAVGPRALEQAGGIADGVILSLMSSHRYVAWALDRVRAGAAAVGRGVELPIVMYVPFVLNGRSAAAIASLKPLMAYYLRRWMPIESLAPLFTSWGPLTASDVVAMTNDLERGRPPESAIPDDFVLDYCVAGSLDDCLDQVDRLAVAGVTDLIIDPLGDLAARRAAIQALSALARKAGAASMDA